MAIAEEIRDVKQQVMVSEGDPNERYPVPSENSFHGDFLAAADLREIAECIIERHRARFGFMRMCEMHYLWKAEGGGTGGKDTLGKCTRASGWAAYLTNATFVIWLAADHCRDMGATRHQVEALLFHEMSHAGIDADKGDYRVLPHDYQGFLSELDHYGFWETDLRRMGRAAIQLGLPGLAAAAD